MCIILAPYFLLTWQLSVLQNSRELHSCWPSPSRIGLLSLSVTGIWGLRVLCCGACPVHHRMFSHVSGLYPTDASCTAAPTCDSQKRLRILMRCILGVRTASGLRTGEESLLFYLLIIFEQGFSLLYIVQNELKFCFPSPTTGTDRKSQMGMQANHYESQQGSSKLLTYHPPHPPKKSSWNIELKASVY